jgi:23S rRNA (guanine2535-N1)-methyltransferase
MQYKYEKVLSDYADLASGRVFYSSPGYPAFPVRLASEIFQRCVANREAIYKNTDPCTLYDPCCGAAYYLSVLAFLHGKHIQEIIASDIDDKAVALANRNLGLLSVQGLDQRVDEITKMIEQYDKESHKEALKSARILRNKIIALYQEHSLRKRVFQASALDNKVMLSHIKAKSVDIAFSDVPYGQHSQWRNLGSNASSNPLWSMLDALLDVLSGSSIVAIVSDKQQRVAHDRYRRVEQFQIGKRRVVILLPI